jgi:hypothetical protein
MLISDFDKGWIIGFIEGEGCFTFDKQGGHPKKNGEIHYVPRFTVNQINAEPLEFLKRFFGGGHIYPRVYTEKDYWSCNKSPRWDYEVNDIETLEKIRDFCEGKLKHPFKIRDFEEWKLLFKNFYGKEGQRELARAQMIARWKDPTIRASIIKSQKAGWIKIDRTA